MNPYEASTPKTSNLTFLAGTEEGVFQCNRRNGRWETHSLNLNLQDDCVESMIQDRQRIFAGTKKSGVWASSDGGLTWNQENRGLQERHVRKLALYLDGTDRVLVGTEPAAIYVGELGSKEWRECREVADLREHFGWELPYSPEEGCVRDFAMGAERVYAAVEVGGILFSPDAGGHWELVEGALGHPASPKNPEPFVHPDVHAVRLAPHDPGCLFAATGRGLFESVDGGTNWEQRTEGYCRDVWIDSQDRAHWLLGSAEGVEQNGDIFETLDSGKSWKVHSEGLGCPWPQDMVDEFYEIGPDLLIRSARGNLYAHENAKGLWTPILRHLPPVRCVTFSEEAKIKNQKGGRRC